jgi:hypothetical protein
MDVTGLEPAMDIESLSDPATRQMDVLTYKFYIQSIQLRCVILLITITTSSRSDWLSDYIFRTL